MVQPIKRQQALSGLAWCFFERCGNQGITFVVSIILARLLEPSVYGVVALVSVFSALISVFTNSGFNAALTQKIDVDDIDYSSVFYFNCFMGVMLYAIMYWGALWISKFYNDISLIPLIRVYSIHLVIGSLSAVQIVYAKKNYLFKKFFWATLGGTIIAAIFGIWLAYSGYGPWALVIQGLLKQTVDVLILWITVGWRPKLLFSISRLRSMFNFGWKILVSGLLDTWFEKIRTLCIGKFYSKDDLAFYYKGNSLPSLIISNINGSINNVLFPSMASLQNNKNALRAYTRRSIKTSTYLIMPLMTLLAVTADSVILILLTEKWLPCVFFMRVFCFTYAFYPVNTANLCAIQAMGRSDIFLRLEILKKTIALALVLSTLWISVKALALSAIASSIISQIINSYPNKKLLDYSYLEQLKDMSPQILLCSIIGIITYSVLLLKLNIWLIIFLQFTIGIILYICFSLIFKIEAFIYLFDIIKNAIQKYKKAF